MSDAAPVVNAPASAPADMAIDRPGRFAGLYPVLLAAYPVLFLWSQNLGETHVVDVVAPLVLTTAAAFGATWLAGRLLGDRRRGALAVAPIVIGALMYGHVANLVEPLHVRALVQQAGWAAIVVLALVAAIRLGRRQIAILDTFLTRISIVLVAVALVLIVPSQVEAAFVRSPVGSSGPLATDTAAPRRDVYYLVFDRYGSDRALELRIGVRNDLTPWLQDHGFTTLDRSHANYIRTVLSLSTTLHMEHLESMLGPLDPTSGNLGPVDSLLIGPPVVRQFQALGYRYIHMGSWWDPTNVDPAADVNINQAGTSDFVTELYGASAGPAVTKRLRLKSLLPTKREEHYAHGLYEFAALDDLVDEPGPKFVFGHVLLPHDPYVFDRDGRYFSNEEVRQLSKDERFARQLDYTNSRIRSLIESLQALPEERRPIIILQADEGPFPAPYAASSGTFDWATATDAELEMKFGILNAWYLPDGEEGLGLYPTMTSINTFPTLFDGYFGLEYEKLPDTIYTSKSWLLPYDMTDVTERIPALR